MQKLNSRLGISSQRNARFNCAPALGFRPESLAKSFKQRWIAPICTRVVASFESRSFQPQRWHSGCNPAFMRLRRSHRRHSQRAVAKPDGSFSNLVTLVVVPPNVGDDAFALTNSAPDATGKDVVVVEPITAGVSLSGDFVDLNIAARKWLPWTPRVEQ